MLDRIENIAKYSKNISVLYVEDEPIARELTADFLETIFDNIIVAVDGEDGLNKFKENKIDLIITDIMMPKINGMEMLKKIKDINKNCYTIILSQHNESDILYQSIKLNVDGYILKPIEFESLLDRIEKVIEKFKFEYEAISHKYYLDQYLDLIENSNVISKTDTKGIITYVSDNFCKISGYKKEELIGQNHSIIKHHENDNKIYEELWDTIKNKEKTWEGLIRNKTKEGKAYYIKTLIKPIKNIEGEVIEYLALRDNLNPIADDKSFLFKEIEKNDLSVLVQVQIDEFDMLDKFYNKTTVAQIEKKFSYKLLSYLPLQYTFENVYYLSDGRFALLADFNSFNSANINLQEYLDAFVTNVRKESLKFDDMEFDLNITVSYSIGKHMIYEDSKIGLETALKEKTKVSFSNDSSILVAQEAKENLDMIKTVKIALDNYNIVSYFQPIINNKTKEIEKYESLVRLIDEEGNILSPFHFLNISKKGNYYNKITERVLENSFKILCSINTKLSINLSASDIEKKQTRTKIFELLEEYKEESHRIIFELLEDEGIKDFNVIKSFIHEVKGKGVQIAIDDFGAGYSNFERVLDFEPDIVKIDGSLVKNIETDMFSRNIVESIVLFAKKQNIQTIAEFVENESIFNILNEIGVDYSQGYYFGKPNEINNK